ncbi:MAG TPA: hypothetical protein VIT88_07125 [Pyrinomonadaceae bacterium]
MIRAINAIILAFGSVGVLSSISTLAHPAWGIVVDRQGQVYFSDLKNIWKIDTQGKLSVFRGGTDTHTHELNIDEAGNVYGEDNFSAIWKMTPEGGFSYISSPTDNPQKGISIWRDRGGNMYSVEQDNNLKRQTLLLKRTPGGDISVLAGGSYGHADGKGGLAKFRNIVGLSFGPDGSLYLTDGSSVRRVATDGTVTTIVRNIVVETPLGHQEGEPAPTYLFGITVNAQGNAFVADYGNRRVLKIAPDGGLTVLIQTDENWFPTGVAAKGDELYILEESHTREHKPIGTRVRKLSTDGDVTVLATIKENGASSGSSAVVDSAGRKSELDHKISYALIGAGVTLCALTVIVWSIRRRRFVSQHKSS